MANKKVKWKPSVQEYCFIKQTDDKPGKLIVGTFGDDNIVTEFDVGGSASAGVNSLNGLQGDVKLTSQDSSVGIQVNGQNIDFSGLQIYYFGWNKGENYIELVTQNGSSYNRFYADTHCQPDQWLTNQFGQNTSLEYYWEMPEGSYPSWNVAWSETLDYNPDITSSQPTQEFAHCVAMYTGPDTQYYPSSTIFYNIYAEGTGTSASGYDLYVSKIGTSLCKTNPNGTFGNGITVVDSGVHIDYNNTNITMSDDGINLTNGDKSITLVPTGFDINGDTFEIKTTATATNTEIQINNGELSIQTSTDSGTNMWYNQNSIEGIMFEYQAMNGDSFIDNELHMDAQGLHFNTVDGDDCYLNYFMTTPNSSNPIATQADLNAIPTIDMHNDGVEITGDATLSSISNCIHTHNGTLNTIVATIEYTATSAITDNNTYITLDTEEFIIPPTFPVIAYDTTINNSIQLRWLGNNIWSLVGSEANHTYIITLYYSYVEGGNN